MANLTNKNFRETVGIITIFSLSLVLASTMNGEENGASVLHPLPTDVVSHRYSKQTEELLLKIRRLFKEDSDKIVRPLATPNSHDVAELIKSSTRYSVIITGSLSLDFLEEMQWGDMPLDVMLTWIINRGNSTLDEVDGIIHLTFGANNPKD